MFGLGTPELVILAVVAGAVVLLLLGVGVIVFVLIRKSRTDADPDDRRDPGGVVEVGPLGSDTDDRPWERPGALRRDSEPHRGNLIQVLGIAGLVTGTIALPSCFCYCIAAPFAVAAIALGTSALVMGNKDLRKMDEGLLDPRGRQQTRLGKNLAIAATIEGALALLLILALVGFMLAMQLAQNPNFF